MGWSYTTDKVTGEKVGYKQDYDKKDGSFRNEKLIFHPDGTRTHEVNKGSTDGGILSFLFSKHRD